VLVALARRHDLDPGIVDDVVLGCATPVGEQGANLGRNAVLAAGWPEAVPGTTVDRQGASSLQAALFAAQGVVAGALDVVVAAGVEVSTTTPAGSWVTPASRPFGPRIVERYVAAGGLVPPGVAAERVAERYRLDRHDLDGWAAESQRRAGEAVERGRFDAEIVPVAARCWDRERRQVLEPRATVRLDEVVRAGATVEDLARSKPMFEPGGRVTAGNSAPVADGAAALLVMSEERAAALGDPLTMLTGVIPATTAALARAGLAAEEVGRFEVDECFAPVTLAWMAEHHADPTRVNVSGGAIALGQAPGCAGARMLATLVHELDRSGDRYGLATLAGVGGVATAVVIERGHRCEEPG
jgi:acetyl-CoA acetyltransferase family protein